MKRYLPVSAIALSFCLLSFVVNIQARHKKQKLQKIDAMPTQQVLVNSQKTATVQSYDELKKTKDELVAAHYKDRAAKILQKMLALATDVNDIATIMIELADTYFELGVLEKAELLYREFGHLYPGNTLVEYALYRAIVCSFYGILDTDRDQTRTRETIARGQEFLSRSSVFRQYSRDVEEMVKKCHEHLFTSELNIARFYGNQGKMTAATTRLAQIEKDFAGKIDNLKPRLLCAECECAQWNRDIDTLEKKTTELVQLYPDYKTEKVAKLARHSSTVVPKLPKRDFVAIF